MSDARRQIAVDVAGIFARQLLAVLPELEAASKDGETWVDAKVAFPRDKSGKLRCRLTVSEVKTKRKRARPLMIELTDDQLALFG